MSKNSILPPHFSNILMLFAVFCSSMLDAQIRNDARFPRHRKVERPESYRVNRVEYRKSDQAIMGIHGIREYAPGFTPEEKAWAYIEKHATKFGIKEEPKNVLQHHFTRDGEYQDVVRFRQMYRGISVDENEIVVTINRAGEVVFASNNTRPVVGQAISTTTRISQKTAESAVAAYFSHRQMPEKTKTSKVVHFVENKPALCYRVACTMRNPQGVWVAYVDARNGKIVEVFDNAHYQCTPYGSGTARIFLPDPISTSGATYGTGGFLHNNDANNASLDAQLRNVVFPIGDQFAPGNSPLAGQRAINLEDIDPCDGSSTSWLYVNNRSHHCFEEVMCYYHIDQNMCYYYDQLNGLPPYQFTGFPPATAVRYIVANGGTSSLYNEETGEIIIGTYTDTENNEIEAGEDAAMIMHELGHGINDWMTGGGISEVQGLGEGFADYWAQSYIRNFGLWKEFEPQYQWLSRWFMFTTEFPTELNRTTDYIVDYATGMTNNKHVDGQLFATAMMRIYDDIGKLKTDLIAIDGIAMTDGGTPQWDAAEKVYAAAVMRNYSTQELCIIYSHFKEIYEDDFDPEQPSGSRDYYMRDTPDDLGAEPNMTTTPIWLSEDIWVRQQDDGYTVRDHQNPKYGQTNYIYVRIRSRNCAPVTDGELWVYFSKASTWLAWPDFWIDYYEQTTHGLILAGDEVNDAPYSLPNDIRAGEERIIEIPWTNMPNPANFDTDDHHFCLLARIVSTQDPMYASEVAEVGQNVKKNNNIAWKNLTILKEGPVAAGTVFVRASQTGITPIQLFIVTPDLPGYVPCPTQGTVEIELDTSLRTIWGNHGEQGTGFNEETGGELLWTGDTLVIEGLYLQDSVSYGLTATFAPDSGAVACAFDLIQLDSPGIKTGGERFLYEPDSIESSFGSTEDRGRVKIAPMSSVSSTIHIYPVPVHDVLQVVLDQVSTGGYIDLKVHDATGKQWLAQNLFVSKGEFGPIQIVTQTLPPGVYFLSTSIESTGKRVDTIRFIKH